MIAMALSIICNILLHLIFLSSAQHLTVHPVDPVVHLGGSVELNCSISCLMGSTNWKGLDINLSGVYIGTGYSILTIENASISMEGTRICVGHCPNHRRIEKHVMLNVYVLPETLHLSISIRNGVPYLHCLMKKVYPVADINVNCFRGDENLKGSTDNDEVQEEEDLTSFTWNWELSKDWKSQTTYRCEVEVPVSQQTFKRVGTLATPTTEKFTPSATPQSLDTLLSMFKTPKVKTIAVSIMDPQVKERTTFGRELSRFPIHKSLIHPMEQKHKSEPLIETTTNANNQKRVMTTGAPKTVTLAQSHSRTTQTWQEWTTSLPSSTSPVFNTRTTIKVLYATNGGPPIQGRRDDTNIIWMVAPAAGLVGTILISLQLRRQMNKKGFFEPKQLNCSDA